MLQTELPGEQVHGTTIRLWLMGLASQALGSTKTLELFASAASQGIERRDAGTLLLAELARCGIEGGTAAAERCRKLLDEAQTKEYLSIAAAAVTRLACLLRHAAPDGVHLSAADGGFAETGAASSARTDARQAA